MKYSYKIEGRDGTRYSGEVDAPTERIALGSVLLKEGSGKAKDVAYSVTVGELHTTVHGDEFSLMASVGVSWHSDAMDDTAADAEQEPVGTYLFPEAVASDPVEEVIAECKHERVTHDAIPGGDMLVLCKDCGYYLDVIPDTSARAITGPRNSWHDGTFRLHDDGPGCRHAQTDDRTLPDGRIETFCIDCKRTLNVDRHGRCRHDRTEDLTYPDGRTETYCVYCQHILSGTHTANHEE